MRLIGGTVAVEDSVASSSPVTGKELHDAYVRDLPVLTLGLVRMRGTSLWVGPIELLRFGAPKIGRKRVDWPIEGGWAARAPGGVFTVQSADGRLVANLEGYRPRVPIPIYAVTQLPIHHLFTRLHLLRVRGRRPEPGVPAGPAKRLAAGAIDVALCAGVAALSGRRRRLIALLGIAAGYHIACWTLGGRTIGGMVMGLRVVAVDGSTPSAGQALVRLATLPAAAVQLRASHDQAAATEVIDSH
jgi:hypothetical protein